MVREPRTPARVAIGETSGDAMHILALLIGLVATIGVVLWRLSTAADAARGLIDTADGLHNAVRRSRWLRRANRDPLDMVEDARIAAATMMVATAQSDGAMTTAERTVILAELQSTFACTERVAEEVLAQARWLVRDKADLGNVLRKLLPVIQRACGPAEKADVVRMLSAVAGADGAPGDIERDAVARVTRELTR